MTKKHLNIPINRVTKNELLYYLYPIEYIAKISEFEYETDKLHELILHIENEIYNDNGTPREVICDKNCGLCHIEVEGHGWCSHTCIATDKDAPLGQKCTVTQESYLNILEHKNRCYKFR